MAASAAKKLRTDAANLVTKAREIELAHITKATIEKVASIKIDGVAKIELGADAFDGYVAMYKKAMRDHLGMIHTTVTTPLWIATLDNGCVVIQCAEKKEDAETYSKLVVFSMERPDAAVGTFPLPAAMKTFEQRAKNLYKGTMCVQVVTVLPLLSHGYNVVHPPTESECIRINAFYRCCSRVYLKKILNALCVLDWEIESPDFSGYYTVLDVLRGQDFLLERLPPHYKAIQSVVYELDDAKTKAEDARIVAWQNKYLDKIAETPPT
jgi:hypothetical protein